MTKTPKLLLTAIFKDDTEFEMIERMLNSYMPHVDGLCVALTGISGKFDKLKKLISSFNGTYVVTSPETHPSIYSEGTFANFAEARNACFELASQLQKEGKYDFWAWADADDILIGGEQLHQVAAEALENKLDAVFFPYWYAVTVDEAGDIQEVVIEHLRERLLRPGVFKWISRLHEVAVAVEGAYKPRQSIYEYDLAKKQSCVWVHLPSNERVESNLQRNIKILEMQAREEEHKDPRTLFYLAKTYYDLGGVENYQLAQMLIQEYLEKSGWDEERANAWGYLAAIAGKRGNHQDAINCHHEALKEFPGHHMTLLNLAKEYYELGLLEKCEFWLERALSMEKPSTRTTIGNPLEVKILAAGLKYNLAIKRQKLDEAIHWLKIRNKLTSGLDTELIAVLEEGKALNDAATQVFNYAKWLKNQGHTTHVRKLMESLPPELGSEPFAQYIANEVAEPKVWDKGTIAYYASWGADHFEGWSGKSLQRGIGGSETAVIRLAEEWVRKGYKVTVFGDPREEVGTINGVEYRPWYEINWKDQFNILILWRSPHLLDKDIKAEKLFMDLHDVASQLDYTPERMAKLDKVFFKSNYHRRMVPKLPDEQSAIISNGI